MLVSSHEHQSYSRNVLHNGINIETTTHVLSIYWRQNSGSNAHKHGPLVLAIVGIVENN
jgi:hypothetical protein